MRVGRAHRPRLSRREEVPRLLRVPSFDVESERPPLRRRRVRSRSVKGAPGLRVATAQSSNRRDLARRRIGCNHRVKLAHPPGPTPIDFRRRNSPAPSHYAPPPFPSLVYLKPVPFTAKIRVGGPTLQRKARARRAPCSSSPQTGAVFDVETPVASPAHPHLGGAAVACSLRGYSESL